MKFARYGIEITEIKQGNGCPSCNQTGYRGRLAIHEILTIDDTIKSHILNKNSPREILEYAKSQGYKTLMEDGLQKVIAGLTTTEEVLRVATSD